MTMISHKSIGLKLCSWNANGILNKISEFKIFIEKHSPDLALIQETHLRPHHNINIPNYNFYRNDRIGDGIARGGTLILVRKNISHYNIPTPTLNHIEATVVVITPQNLNPISIISIYVPPTSDARLFTLDLENLLQTNSITNPTVLEEKIEFFTAAVRSAHQFASKPIANKNHAYNPNYIHNLIRDKNRAKKKYNNTLNPRGRSTGAVFLDIQKAFDRVWVSGLIYKLITNNFPPALIHLINSYLVNRTFQVRVNDTLSNSLSIKYGVPQGSLLGPFLFNIYINDIPTHPQTSSNIYADDTVTLATYKNHKTITIALNNHLKLLETFFDTWKIKINVDKTIAVLFTNRKTQPTPPTLYSTQLQWSQSTKYLGLTLDKKLTWKQHIIQTRDKFRRAQRAIFPLIGRNSELNMYNKLLLYTAVLRPILTYGSPVWGYAADSNIKILEVAQNSLIRNIVKANRYARNIKIYEDIKILPFKAYIQKLAIFFFNNLPNINNENVKMLNNYIPVPDLKRPRRILLDSYNPP
ncbi:RNA-directed DNA polymerase from mobile element jockey [Trichonephila clavipes]|nr:RNA-directed DNA polymerase from mobile element jockey [Trichonephila clavipes]